MIRRILSLLLLLLVAVPRCAYAQQDSASVKEPLAEDFVLASVCVASPGSELYSILGHACLRLQCPEHSLDYIYSYEGEDIDNNIALFFAGKLKMRVASVPTQEYVDQYRPQGRGVTEYRLNLPIRVKQRLWQQMDARLECGAVPYDYMNHGCAVSVLGWLEDAIGADSLEFTEWPATFHKSRKELARDVITHPWYAFWLETFIAGEGLDTEVPNIRKACVPQDMLFVISHAKAFGQNLVEGKPVMLLEAKPEIVESTPVTPIMVSLVILAVCLLNLLLHFRAVDYLMLIAASLLGWFVAYLVFVSDLTCTEWNWLIVPFNPLLLICWKWRRRWALPYAAVCVLWSAVLFLHPRQFVDGAHLVLAVAMAVNSVEFILRKKNTLNNLNRIMRKLLSARFLSLLMVMFTMFSLPAVGSNNKDYFSKVTVKAVGEGKVYVNKDKVDSPEYAKESSAESGADNQSSAPNHTYYLYAQPEDGSKFVGWYSDEACEGDVISQEAICSVEITAATNVADATKTYYAKFASAGDPVFICDDDHIYINITDAPAVSYGMKVENVSATYVSGNDNIATVDADGKITPVAAGSTIITASADGYEDITFVVTVIDNINAGITQIGNGDFEDWSNVNSDNHAPNNWNSFETCEGSLASTAGKRQIAMSEDHRPGSNGLYSVDIYSRSVFGVVAQGNLTLGCINAGDMTADKSANHNFSKITDPAKSETISKIPTAVKVWVKFVPAGNVAAYPYARVAATVHDAHNYITHGAAKNDTEANKAYAVAHAEQNFAACDWTELTLPFTLTNNAVVDGQLYIVFNASTNAYPGKGTAGDHLYIDDIELIYGQDYDKVPVQISDAKIGTFVAPFDVKMPAAITASTVDDVMVDGATLSLTEVEKNVVPANTPVILQSDAAQNRVAYGVAAPATAKAGLLTGVYENTVAPAGSFVLQNQNGVVGFYEVLTGQTLNVGANRCYLEAPVAGAKGFFFNADDATAIQSVGQSASQNAEGIYNLAGQRVQKMQKGINIVNGKKVLY